MIYLIIAIALILLPFPSIANENLDELMARHGDTQDRVAVVSHGLFYSFMMKVLLRIPSGTTRSYGEMAELVGAPGGARAAGRANGANYISIIIPCHRVIEASGGLGGYGGKIWRKKRLLELESAQTLILAE